MHNNVSLGTQITFFHSNMFLLSEENEYFFLQERVIQDFDFVVFLKGSMQNFRLDL